MYFFQVANYFELINNHSSRIEITKLLSELFIKATDKEAYILSYLSLGLLRPPYKGTQFQVAEKNIIKALTQFLSLKTEDLLDNINKKGDIGLALLSYSWENKSELLTLEQVYDNLCHLEKISGEGSVQEKVNLLVNLLSSLDNLSASYVLRIIIGTLRLGFSDMTLIDAFSWSITGDKTLRPIIENAYNMCADIGLIAQLIKKGGIEGITHIEPEIGIPIRPAAAERLPNVASVIEKLGLCVAQPKLDGFRLQIHIDNRVKDDRKVWFFSRNLQDMSNMFPDLLLAFNNFEVETLIVEGEAIVYDEETGTFLPFQETVKRKRKHNIQEVSQSLPLKLFLFDILYINGESMLSSTHEQRRKKLTALVNKYSLNSTILAIEEKYTPDVKSLENYFNEQISKGLEGLVVKKPNSIYQPGKRNFNWIKLKRHIQGHLDDTIDAVILGYYFGRGKRTTFGIGAFLVGLYNRLLDRFETVAKIGTGLKDADWIDIKKQCDSIAVVEKPHNIECAPELMPDVWVNPQIVVVILADEITKSPLHSAGKIEQMPGFALRFPRFMGYSIDKIATQATSILEIQELFKQQYN